MSKAADLAGYQIALKTALIEFTDGDDAIAIADAGVVTLLKTAVAKSEGGAVTTNIAQGLVKAWINFNGTGTIATRDSFNVSSIADNSTANFTITIDAAMANINFSLAGMSGAATMDQYVMVQPRTAVPPTTTATNVNSPYANASGGDALLQSVVYFGDLA